MRDDMPMWSTSTLKMNPMKQPILLLLVLVHLAKIPLEKVNIKRQKAKIEEEKIDAKHIKIFFFNL